LRLLFCTLNFPPFHTGGTEHQAHLQARELCRRGHSVTVLCPRRGEARDTELDGITVRRLPIIDQRPFRTVSHLAVLCLWLLRNGRKFDIVHVHLANLQADVAALATKLIRRPLYIKIACGGPPGEVSRVGKVAWLTRWFGLRHADRVQALSGQIRDELLGIGVAPDRIIEIPNGIDLSHFAPATANDTQAAREKLDLPVGESLILYAGRFASYKGIRELLAAWSGIDARQAKLLLVGTTDTHYALDPIESGPTVTVRDWTSEIVDYLHAADVFVSPSYGDGMSNAVLEAMASGLPVIVSRVGATTTLVEDGREGLLVTPRDEHSLGRALVRLLDDGTLRRKLGAAAARKMQAYSIIDVVDRIEAAYRVIIDERDD
jgi:glycosyltransferase involved in cell wall biosynthesis